VLYIPFIHSRHNAKDRSLGVGRDITAWRGQEGRVRSAKSCIQNAQLNRKTLCTGQMRKVTVSVGRLRRCILKRATTEC